MTAATAPTPQLVEDFRRDGFVVLPDLLTAAEGGDDPLARPELAGLEPVWVEVPPARHAGKPSSPGAMRS